MADHTESICRRCFHSYVCEQFNEHRDDNNKKCHFCNDHFVPAADVAPVRQWISVDERLPEPDTDVLARRSTGMDVECYHKEDGGYWSWDEYSGKWRVTHWMPLPEGPEVEV